MFGRGQRRGREGYLKPDSSASVANQACRYHGEVSGARPNVQKRLPLFWAKRLKKQVSEPLHEHLNCGRPCKMNAAVTVTDTNSCA